MPEIKAEITLRGNETYNQGHTRLSELLNEEAQKIRSIKDGFGRSLTPGFAVQEIGNRLIGTWKYKQYPKET